MARMSADKAGQSLCSCRALMAFLPELGELLGAIDIERGAKVSGSRFYYLTGPGQRDRYVIRHRFDDELQQLTIKSLTDDTAVRDEINLDLGHHAGDQADAVEAFVGVGRMNQQFDRERRLAAADRNRAEALQRIEMPGMAFENGLVQAARLRPIAVALQLIRPLEARLELRRQRKCAQRIGLVFDHQRHGRHTLWTAVTSAVRIRPARIEAIQGCIGAQGCANRPNHARPHLQP